MHAIAITSIVQKQIKLYHIKQKYRIMNIQMQKCMNFMYSRYMKVHWMNSMSMM